MSRLAPRAARLAAHRSRPAGARLLHADFEKLSGVRGRKDEVDSAVFASQGAIYEFHRLAYLFSVALMITAIS
jgi:hypothetical protein